MVKNKNVFVCNECGYESTKWLGKCPACNSWNSFIEQKVVSKKEDGKNKEITMPKPLIEFQADEGIRNKTNIGELDRVLGGGFVEGSLTLLGGEPGIGKSTLLLQVAGILAKDGKVLYVSGEESASQIKLRADRLGIADPNILFFGETNIEIIDQTIINVNPKLVIIDSIQTMYSDDLSSAIGSVSQIREITSKIMQICKNRGITTILIGHVTKDGNIARPRVLEHMVDTVLYIEGERFAKYRVIRSMKNRFGSTNEIGMFEMSPEGMLEIENSSEVLLTESTINASGSCILSIMEGTRPILVEVQALTAKTFFPMPKRTANGIDFNKFSVLIALLEKKLGFKLADQDVYLNVVGGIRLSEPSIDLAVLASIVSSYVNKPIDNKTVIIGEVGLTGEIRRVQQIEKRIKEIQKLGFSKVIIPKANEKDIKENFDIKIVSATMIDDALKKIGLVNF